MRFFTHVDYVDRMALVAVLGEELVAVARYEREPGTDRAEVAFVVEDVHQGRGIATVLLEHLAGLLGVEGVPDALRAGTGDRSEHRIVPSFPFPESAAQALARASAYAAGRSRPPGEVPKLEGIDRPAARALVERVLAGHPDGTWLDLVTGAEILSCYGIGTAPAERVASAEEAAEAAGRLGFPVALKTGSGTIVHKTDVGGVRLGLGSPEEVRSAYVQMATRLGPAMGGRPADGRPRGRGHRQRRPGPCLRPLGDVRARGGGGRGDRRPNPGRHSHHRPGRSRPGPLAALGSPPHMGFRGTPPADLAALEQLLLRVGLLAEQLPEIAEMDLNPVVASPAGAVTVDCKIRLVPSERATRRRIFAACGRTARNRPPGSPGRWDQRPPKL